MYKKIVLSALLNIIGCFTVCAQELFQFGTAVNPKGETFQVDSKGFIVNGKHVLPVMGEIHYARVPKKDWRREIRKMKAGGITVVATYVFWIHHEETEGIFDWSGDRDLHQFVNICKEEGMPVVLRLGPFCHGEVYQGGFPVWLTDKVAQDNKMYKLRSLAPGFMKATERWYANIFAQVNGLLWKDGGPIVGVQIENECRGPWPYYAALKEMAVRIGFDVPFYTRTGWPKLNGKEVFGQMLPLYGDYADGFWDRNLKDMPGDYPKAFIMKDERMSRVIATETFSAAELNGGEKSETPAGKGLTYPYLTCELGGGMNVAYHRRVNMSGNEPLPLAICKVGSGSNLPGYYMYHGGTNPDHSIGGGNHSMAEVQNSATTANNDIPYKSYDFQSPLGEMGQLNENAYHQTRIFHQFLADWGEMLSQMDVDSLSEHYARRGCFEFYNDYVRILNENGVSYVRPVAMPFKGHKVTADAQPYCIIGDTIYFVPIKGKKPMIWIDGKKVAVKLNKVTDVPAKGGEKCAVCVLSDDMTRKVFKIDGQLMYADNGGVLYKDGNEIVEEWWHEADDAKSLTKVSLVKNAGKAREVRMGKAKVAEQPSDEDFEQAAVYELTFEKPLKDDVDDCFVRIDYAGDCARVYADGKMVEDNYWNGKPMLVRCSDIAGKKVKICILPMRKDAPVYLQKEQKAVLNDVKGDSLLQLNNVTVIVRETKTKIRK